MKSHHDKLALKCILVVAAAAQAFSQTNLIVNGDFTDTSGWNVLGQYNGGQATGTFSDGAYVIDVLSPGPDTWSIQFTQNRLRLDSGCVYSFSYDLSATVDRTIEVSLSRSGDYISYSGFDTLSISSRLRHFERTFVMRHPSDRNVRIDFNCGKAGGTIEIRNVRLVKIMALSIKVTAPGADELHYEGVPLVVSWESYNIVGGVNVEVSIDNGASWKTIGALSKDTGSIVWIPSAPYSPWCRFRVSSEKNGDVYGLNEGPFEIAPRREMVENGRFLRSAEPWRLGVFGGKATGGVVDDSMYRLVIENSAEEYRQIQLTQNGIPLEQGTAYLLTFTAYAENPSDVKVRIGMDHDPYTVYVDSTKWVATLTAAPKRYDFLFTMRAQSDSNGLLEFNCGKSRGAVYIGEISLVPQYVASALGNNHIQRVAESRSTKLLFAGGRFRHFTTRDNDDFQGAARLIDLKGRNYGIYLLCRNAASMETTTAIRRPAPGVYLQWRGMCSR